MDLIVIDNAGLDKIINSLTRIELKINELLSKNKSDSYEIVSNDDFCKMLGISKRTAQNYRDQGLLSFSIIRKKIFYRRGEVNDFLDKHRKARFKCDM